jgi:hypothetical protein
MRIIVYLLIIKGVLFAAAMMMPNSEQERTFGASEPAAAMVGHDTA